MTSTAPLYLRTLWRYTNAVIIIITAMNSLFVSLLVTLILRLLTKEYLLHIEQSF